jgi:hypothetical protein
VVCGSGHSSLNFNAVSVNYDLWVDFDGTLTRSTVAAGITTTLPSVSGLHHVFLRTQEAGGTIGGYDIFLDGTNCQAMGFLDVQFPG